MSRFLTELSKGTVREIDEEVAVLQKESEDIGSDDPEVQELVCKVRQDWQLTQEKMTAAKS